MMRYVNGPIKKNQTTTIREKVGWKCPCIFNLQEGARTSRWVAERSWQTLAQWESLLPFSSRIYGRCKHFSAAPTHFYLVDSRTALSALTSASVSLQSSINTRPDPTLCWNGNWIFVLLVGMVTDDVTMRCCSFPVMGMWWCSPTDRCGKDTRACWPLITSLRLDGSSRKAV